MNNSNEMNNDVGSDKVNQNDTFSQLLTALKSGALSVDDLKALKNAMKPKSSRQIAREKAQEVIDTFRSLGTIPGNEIDAYPTFGALIDDYLELVEERDSFGRGTGNRTVHATKKWRWLSKEDFTIFYDGEDEVGDVELSVHPDSNSWVQEFKDAGYTDGQLAAVRKERYWRKNRGFLTREEWENL